MAQRVTQSGVEVLYEGTDQKARVTQSGVEVLYLGTDQKARVTMSGVEVLYLETGGAQPRFYAQVIG